MAYKRIFVRSHPTAQPCVTYIGEHGTVADAIREAQFTPEKSDATFNNEPVAMDFDIPNESEIILTPKKYSSGNRS